MRKGKEKVKEKERESRENRKGRRERKLRGGGRGKHLVFSYQTCTLDFYMIDAF